MRERSWKQRTEDREQRTDNTTVVNIQEYKRAGVQVGDDFDVLQGLRTLQQGSLIVAECGDSATHRFSL